MSLNSKRKRHLKWLKKKEAKLTPVVDLQTYPDTRGTTPVVLSQYNSTREEIQRMAAEVESEIRNGREGGTYNIHSEPVAGVRRILSNETFSARITWPDRSGNGHDLHAEPETVPSVRGSIDNPANTIAEAASIAQSGQTIFVAPGTYRTALNVERVVETNPLNRRGYDTPFFLSPEIMRLLEENRGELLIPEYIKRLVEADADRKRPAEVIVPAIRHLDLED